MSSARCRWGIALLLSAMWLMGSSGCGTSSASSPRGPRSDPPLQPVGDLRALIPRGAVRTVWAQPRELLVSPVIRRIVSALVPEAYWENFALRTGVDPREVSDALLAEYESGFTLLVRGPWSPRAVVHATGARMNGLVRSRNRPFFSRTGRLGRDLREVVALGANTVLVSSNPKATALMLARVARGKWRETGDAALARPAANRLAVRYRQAPLVLISPLPLALSPHSDLSVLLSHHRALAAALVSIDEDRSHLGLEVALVGSFPPHASENFRSLMKSIAQDDLGAAFGMQSVLSTLTIEQSDEEIVIRASWPAAELARGLRVLFTGELRELLGPG